MIYAWKISTKWIRHIKLFANANRRRILDFAMPWDGSLGQYAMPRDFGCGLTIWLASDLPQGVSYLPPKSCLPSICRIWYAESRPKGFEFVKFSSTYTDLFDLLAAFDNIVDVSQKILVATARDAVSSKFFSNLHRCQSIRMFAQNHSNCLRGTDSCRRQGDFALGFRERRKTVPDFCPCLKLFLYALFFALQFKDFLLGFG